MTVHGDTKHAYVMGHSEHELERLVKQSDHLRDQSEALLRIAGLAPGMRVLDIGCGLGDLSILAARLVGPAGTVVGLDRSVETIEQARQRAARLSPANLRFEVCDVSALDEAAAAARLAPGGFDALIGRLILIHLRDPAATLRRLREYLSPSGIVAFQELDTHCAESDPHSELFSRNMRWLGEALRFVQADPRGGIRQARVFQEAGLPLPRLMLTAKVEVGTPDTYIFRYMAETTRTLLPVIIRAGIASHEEVGIESLEDRLREEALRNRATLINVGLVGAYCQLGEHGPEPR